MTCVVPLRVQVMQVDGLTYDNIKSHLQKYRRKLEKKAGISGPVGTKDCPELETALTQDIADLRKVMNPATAPVQAEVSEAQLQDAVDKLAMSNVKGVYITNGGQYKAQMQRDGQKVFLGNFDTLPQTALAWDLAVLMSDVYRAGPNAPTVLSGRTARPNLPVCLNTWEKRESLHDDLGVLKKLMKQRFAHSNARQQKYTVV